MLPNGTRITRLQFEAATAPLMDRVLEPVLGNSNDVKTSRDQQILDPTVGVVVRRIVVLCTRAPINQPLGRPKSSFLACAPPSYSVRAPQVKRVLSDVELTAANVDEVVLVGGATRMPRLRHLLHQHFGYWPARSSRLDELKRIHVATCGC